MNYHKGFIAPLLLILIALLLAGGAYTYMQKSSNQPVTTTPTTQTSNSQTAVWKTYVSKERGFELKYPANWSPSSAPVFLDSTKNPDGSSFFSVSISGSNYILQIMDGASPSDTQQGSVEKNISFINKRAGQLIVEDKDAIPIVGGEAFYSLNEVPGDLIPNALLVGKNEILLMQITAIYSNSSDNSGVSSQQGEPLLRQILSTFKFDQ